MWPYCITDVALVYEDVIMKVIENSRPFFLEEGYDEAVLQLLKQTWQKKLQESNVIPVVPMRTGKVKAKKPKSDKKRKPTSDKERKPKKQKSLTTTQPKTKRWTRAAAGEEVQFYLPMGIAPSGSAASSDMPDLDSYTLTDHSDDNSSSELPLSAIKSQNERERKGNNVVDMKTLSNSEVKGQPKYQAKTLEITSTLNASQVEQQKQGNNDDNKIKENRNAVMDAASKITENNREKDHSEEILPKFGDLLSNLAEAPNENDADNNVLFINTKQSNDMIIKNSEREGACNKSQTVKTKLNRKASSQSPHCNRYNLIAKVQSRNTSHCGKKEQNLQNVLVTRGNSIEPLQNLNDVDNIALFIDSKQTNDTIIKSTKNGSACNSNQTIKSKLNRKTSQSSHFLKQNLVAKEQSTMSDEMCSVVKNTSRGKKREPNLQNLLVTRNITLQPLHAQGALNQSNKLEENCSRISMTSSAVQITEEPLVEPNVMSLSSPSVKHSTIPALEEQEMHSENKLHTSKNQHLSFSQEEHNFGAQKKHMATVESNTEALDISQQTSGDIADNREIAPQVILHGHQSITTKTIPKQSNTDKVQQAHSLANERLITNKKRKLFNENRILSGSVNEATHLTASNDKNVVGTKRHYLPKIVVNGVITDGKYNIEQINNCDCLSHSSSLASRDTYISTLEKLTDNNVIEEVKIILPNTPGMNTKERSCLIAVPRWLLEGTQLPSIITPLIKKVSRFSVLSAKCILQHHVNKALEKYSQQYSIVQCDGPPHGAKFHLLMKVKNTKIEVTEKRLSNEGIDSDDDETDNEDPTQVFESQNVIFCCYKLVKRTKNIFKITLSCGLMRLNDKEYVFDRADGRVEW